MIVTNLSSIPLIFASYLFYFVEKCKLIKFLPFKINYLPVSECAFSPPVYSTCHEKDILFTDCCSQITSAFFVFIRVHYLVKDRFRESPLSFVIILAVLIKTFENILLNQPSE